MKENKIPLGKKREVFEKTKELKKSKIYLIFSCYILIYTLLLLHLIWFLLRFEIICIIIKYLLLAAVDLKQKSSKTIKKKTNGSQCLTVINVNAAPTDTSLTKAVKNPRAKLSTIEEIKELEDKAAKSIIINAKTKLNSFPAVSNDTTTSIKNKNIPKEVSTKLVENVQKENYTDNFNNSIDKLNTKTPVPEIVLSPYVCTTRGQKWKPSPRKPPKLSELFDKYEDDNVADTYKYKFTII